MSDCATFDLENIVDCMLLWCELLLIMQRF